MHIQIILGGMKDIIDNFDIGIILVPFISEAKMITDYRKVLESVENKFEGEDKIKNPEIGYTFEIGDANCVVKYIDNNEPSKVNNSSVVIEMTLGEQGYLFMGDIEKEVENLGKRSDDKKIEWREIDVLKVGHHGSSSSSTEYFINVISPEIAIISVGENNKYNHPVQAVLDRLIKICNKNGVYRTDRDGTIFLVNENGENKITLLTTNVNSHK